MRKWGWALACFGAACVSMPMTAAAQWSVKAQAGLVASRGNAESDAANAKLDVEREFEKWKHQLQLAGIYASDDTGATSQRWSARGQTDYKFHEKGFSFVSARYEEDRFSGFEFQATYGAGLGWRFFDDEVTKLIAQVGAGYKVLETRDSLAADEVTLIPGERSEDLIGQFVVDFERVLTDSTKVLNKFLTEFGPDNTFIQNDLSLQVQIMDSLALALGYSVRHNTEPPRDFRKTDTLTTINLVYELK